MATLRTRLTVAYGFALIGGLIVFAVALWTVRVASGIDALGPTAIEQGDRVLEPLRAWALNGHPLLEDQTPADSATARRSASTLAASGASGCRYASNIGQGACSAAKPAATSSRAPM